MQTLIEFFGSEDAFAVIAAVSFIVVTLVLLACDKIRVIINRKRRAENNKKIHRQERIKKRKVLETKAFDFAMTYYSIESKYPDETTVVYKEVFV